MIESSLTAFGALLLVLGLLVGLLYGARKLRLVPGAPTMIKGQRDMKILENLPVSTNTRLIVVAWRGRDYMLSVGPGGVTQIANHSSSLESEPAERNDGAHAPSNEDRSA